MRILLHYMLLVSLSGSCVELKFCPAPTIIPASLYIDQDFPTGEVESAWRDVVPGILEYFRAKENALFDGLKEDGMAARPYPDCLEVPVCKGQTDVIQNWRVEGHNCWVIEPIYWVTCLDSVPDFQCEVPTEGTGYQCQQLYHMQKVWVYCRDVKPCIQSMSVNVSFACGAVGYDCTSP